LLSGGDVEGRVADVVGPAVDELGGPLHPAGDGDVEVGQESTAELVECCSLGKGAFAGQIGMCGGEVLAVLVEDPRPCCFQVDEDVCFGAAIGEVDLEELLELERRSGTGLLQPPGEGSAALGGDGVAGAAAATDGASSVPRRACSAPAATAGAGCGRSAGPSRGWSTV
jgi:hypothetical protein